MGLSNEGYRVPKDSCLTTLDPYASKNVPK